MGPTASPRERGRGRDRGGRTEERTLSVSHIYITHVRALHPTVFPSFFSDGRLPWALGASAFATVYRGPSYRHRPHYPRSGEAGVTMPRKNVRVVLYVQLGGEAW